MIDQNLLRVKAIDSLITVRNIADASKLEYTYVSRWLKGQDIGEKACRQIKEGLKQLKS